MVACFLFHNFTGKKRHPTPFHEYGSNNKRVYNEMKKNIHCGTANMNSEIIRMCIVPAMRRQKILIQL